MRAAERTGRTPSRGSCGCRASQADPCRCSTRSVPNVMGSTGSLARKSSGGAGAGASVPALVGAVVRSPGVPLPSAVRSDFESRFAHDFSRVRIHADPVAARSARQVGALAYTVGRHIAFAGGEYDPTGARGRDTLAHELAHVVQQRTVADGQVPTAFSAAGEEREADRQAGAALEGRRPPLPPARPARLARRLTHEGSYRRAGEPEVQVRRDIDEGRCVWHDEAAAAAGIDLSHAFLSFTVCRGSTRGSGNIDVEYGSAVSQAMQAVNTFLSNPLAPGAGDTLRRTLESIGPNISASFELRMGPVLAALTGFAHVDMRGRVTGSGGPAIRVPVGQDELEIGATISGGTGQPTTVGGQLVWRFGGARSSENCGRCDCSDPSVTYTCTELPPPSEPDRPARPAPVAIPIQFEYATTQPVDGMGARVARIVSLVQEGYTVNRIVGNASPEGDEMVVPPPRPGRFAGNIPLSQARAEAARDLVQAAVNGRAQILRRDHPFVRNLGRAFSSNPPVVGTGELFGRSGAREVPRAGLYRHLTSALRAPDPGQRDPLEEAGVLGGNLPADIDASNRAEVDAFRSAPRAVGRRRQQQQLAALYPLLRRALVELAPPPVHVPTGVELEAELRRQRAADEARVRAGHAIPCEARHLEVLPSLRTLRLHTGNCGLATAPLDTADQRTP
jgi:hypothetical protein